MIGRTISHYKILEKIGAGGMGVIYKAEDTNLDRTVALKFLPPAFASDPATKERFIHEAKAASALQHSNICTIHEIGETDDGQMYMVMDFYEGETLRLKIEKGKLKIHEAVDYTIQIAQGLQKAHEKGIIHRDIKSANIMITNDGEVKILDFGLAKFKGWTKVTKSGSTLGTIAYMSPEQLRGIEIDQKSDIWSLGVLFYEMLSGQLPFKGEFDESLMYSIVNNEPEPIEKLRSDISSDLLHVLNRSLEKNPDDRYQHVDDLIVDIRRSLRQMHITTKEESIIATGKHLKRKTILIVFSVAVSILSLIFISFFILKPFSYESLPDIKTIPITTFSGAERWPTFSPDGTQIAFSWSGEKGDNSDIYVKLIGLGTQDKDRLTEHPGYDFMPAWSPDGRYIAFGRISGDENSIYTIPARGGIERKLVSVTFAGKWGWLNNLSWSPDSKSIVFSAIDSTSNFYRIFLLSIDDRHIKKLTSGPDISFNDYFCAISSDGKILAFTRGADQPSSDIYLVQITGGKEERITFDNNHIVGLTWTKNGREIVFSSNRGGSGFSLWRISAVGGNISQIPASGEDLRKPVLSKQGNLLASERWASDLNIWRFEIPISEDQKNMPSRFIYSTQGDYQPEYSPDRKKIVYTSHASGFPQLWICDHNGKNEEQLTYLEEKADGGAPEWSPDGRRIAFDQTIAGQHEIFTISAEGGSAVNISKNSAEDHTPRYSIDGNWIYFNSKRSGDWQIWKIPAQGGEAIQITDKGGYVAFESQDGNCIYYAKYDTTGIWKKQLPDGDESIILNYDIEWQHWVLVENGIYFIIRTENGKNVLNFYNFRNENLREIVNLGTKTIQDMCVSPDRNFILYSQRDLEESDIILVENFR
jgi:serine/threonine protein kinase